MESSSAYYNYGPSLNASLVKYQICSTSATQYSLQLLIRALSESEYLNRRRINHMRAQTQHINNQSALNSNCWTRITDKTLVECL